MKKTLFIFIAFICIISNPIISHAASPQSSHILLHKMSTKIKLENEITVEYNLEEYASNARSNSKTSVKTVTYKKNDRIIATIRLSADFTYTGSSATCTRASSSYSMSDGWSYSNKSTTYSGNTAKTSAKISKSKEYFNANVTITCSGSGEIS